MDFIKIVFTGGPCAGKTTLINRAKEYLIEKGYKVLVVPETATNLLEIGINLELVKSVIDFQNFIFQMQQFNENIVCEALKNEINQKVIILLDRGLLDNKAYCNNSKDFDVITKQNNKFEIDILDNYNLVFDLITTADCSPHKYTLENNKQRSESIEEAKEIDKKTSNAWAGHRNIKIINSNVSLDKVFDIIKEDIDNYIEKASKKEIKKLSIDNNILDFDNYNDNNSRLLDIEETSLKIQNKEIKYVLYKRVYKGGRSYIFRAIKEDENFVTTYYDEKITLEKYLNLIFKYGIKDRICYKQLSFIENRQNYDIKFYQDSTVLEYEENKLNSEFIFPSILKVNEKNDNNKILLK